jgi:gas vesicle protein
MSKGKVIFGVLAGFAVGAALGVLFAPDSGWNTRKRITKKGEDLVDDLKEKFNDFIDTISVKVDEVKEDVADFAGKKSRTAESKKEAKSATT